MNTATAAVWLKELSFEDESATTKLRTDAAKAVSDVLKPGEIEGLVRAVFTIKGRPENLALDRLAKACVDTDPAFPSHGNERQLVLMAGLVLDLRMADTAASEIGVLCALAINTATVAGRRAHRLPVDLAAAAVAALDRATCEGRRRPELLKAASALSTVASPSTPTLAAFDQASIQAGLEGIMSAFKSHTANVTKKFSGALSAVDRFLKQQDDELQMLWWLIGSRSLILDCSLDQVPDELRPLLVAEELAACTKVCPGPMSIASLFARAGLKAGKELPLAKMVADASNAAALGRIVASAQYSPTLLPLHFAIERQMEVASGDQQWLPAWSNLTGLPETLALDPIAFATQAYRERVLFDAFKRATS